MVFISRSGFNITKPLPSHTPTPMPYQLNSKTLFLTYPQCNVPPQDALSFFQDLFEGLLEYVVARELHKNGDEHLHAYIKLDGPFRTRDPNALDLLFGDNRFHGNYQGARSVKNVIKYCTKADDFITNMDLDALLLKGSARKKIAEDLVLKKRVLSEVVQENPTLLFGYSRLKIDLLMLMKDMEPKMSMPLWLPNPWGKVLPTFRQSKRRHYWIFSRKPNVGKTHHFAKPLKEEYGAVIANDFSYWNVNQNTQCIILDEYNGASLKYSQLNSLADGTFQFRIFQGGLIEVHNYIVIVLSNQPISEIYPFMNVLLYERFNEIEITL